MSASWSNGRLPELTPARRIRPATDWPKVAGWVGAFAFSIIVWTVGLLLAGWLLGWSW